MQKLSVIGSTDKIDLPTFDLSNIRCKIDTGALSSSIHCSEKEVVERNGTKVLRFKVLDEDHPQFLENWLETIDFDERDVKSSNGQVEPRFFIRAQVLVLDQIIEAEFSLADRSTMSFPVLLGKSFLYKNFMVDVSLDNVSYRNKKLSKRLNK